MPKEQKCELGKNHTMLRSRDKKTNQFVYRASNNYPILLPDYERDCLFETNQCDETVKHQDINYELSLNEKFSHELGSFLQGNCVPFPFFLFRVSFLPVLCDRLSSSVYLCYFHVQLCQRVPKENSNVTTESVSRSRLCATRTGIVGLMTIPMRKIAVSFFVVTATLNS